MGLKIDLSEGFCELEIETRKDAAGQERTLVILRRGQRSGGREAWRGTLEDLVDAVELGQRAMEIFSSKQVQDLIHPPKRTKKTRNKKDDDDEQADRRPPQ